MSLANLFTQRRSSKLHKKSCMKWKNAVCLLLVVSCLYQSVCAKTYRFWRSEQYVDADLTLVKDELDETVDLENPDVDSVTKLAQRVFNDTGFTVLYSLDGSPITSYEDVQMHDNFVVFKYGETFTWQGIEAGHTRVVPTNDRTVTLKTLSTSPRVFLIEKFATKKEVETILAKIKLNTYPLNSDAAVSQLVFKNGLPYDFTDSLAQTLLLRATNLTRAPTRMLEPIIQLYRQAAVARASLLVEDDMIPNFPSRRNHVGILLLFLNDITDGGELVFPLADKSKINELYDITLVRRMCDGEESGAVKVKARAGDAVLFYTMSENPDQFAALIDDASYHVHCDHLSASGKYVIKFPFVNLGPIELVDPGRRVYVFSDYTPDPPMMHYFSIKEGDIIYLVDDRAPIWWEGVLNGRRGFFPRTHVQKMPYTKPEIDPRLTGDSTKIKRAPTKSTGSESDSSQSSSTSFSTSAHQEKDMKDEL